MSSMDIWTDGSCLGNPGPGGWAFVIVEGGVATAERSGGEPASTNNRMELLATISAIESLAGGPHVIHLHADSRYVQDGITKWIHGWKRNGWMTSLKQPVKNVDLWQRLDAAVQQHRIHWVWVKGHAADLFNNRCDELARAAAGTRR